jgi:hypothetical protein
MINNGSISCLLQPRCAQHRRHRGVEPRGWRPAGDCDVGAHDLLLAARPSSEDDYIQSPTSIAAFTQPALVRTGQSRLPLQPTALRARPGRHRELAKADIAADGPAADAPPDPSLDPVQRTAGRRSAGECDLQRLDLGGAAEGVVIHESCGASSTGAPPTRPCRSRSTSPATLVRGPWGNPPASTRRS